MRNSIQGSAKIYQFPVRQRALISARSAQATVRQSPEPQVKVMASSGWYHDAAIEEAGRSGKH